MKILMSGMSTRTVGSPRLKLNYINFNPLLRLALEEMGHEVDQRKLQWNEDLSGYDAAFLHVAPLDKIVCQNIPEVLQALDKMRDRAVIFCEDWVSWEFRNAAAYVLGPRWKGWLRWKGFTEGDERVPFMRRMIEELVAPNLHWPVIANFYGWGDPTEFFKRNFYTERCQLIDPSPMVDTVRIPKYEVVKSRQWVCAALQKHDDWINRQGFSWPVLQYGNARQGLPVLSEDEVIAEYGRNWGVLAPRYPVRGWFRPRFLLAAEMGSVMYCDREEGALLGPLYQLPVKAIEVMTDSQLVSVARAQAELFKSKIWGKERLLAELSFLLEHLTEMV